MSTYGLRIKNPTTGAVVLDTSTSMVRILGTVQTASGKSGSVTNSGFGTGQPFFMLLPMGNSDASSTYIFPSFNGTTLSWGAATIQYTIVYGVRS